MPIFEYRCPDCGARFEKIVGPGSSQVACKTCGSRRVEKLISVFAVVGGSGKAAATESGPCGACGAPRRGMCGE